MKRSEFLSTASRRFRNSRRGFTLIEILIVLGIIAVIAALAVPRLLGQRDAANVKATTSAILSAQQAVDLYSATTGQPIPEGGDEIWQTLMQKGPNNEPATLDKIPVDAWGRQLHYLYPNTKSNVETDRPAIWSDGLKANDPSDDVNNWDTLNQQPK